MLWVLHQGSQDIAVSSSADISGVVQIQNIPITTARGQVIPLSEVAQVGESQKAADSLSRYNGQDNVTIAITKKKSYGTVDVTRDVERMLEQLQADNDVVVIDTIYNASDMIISSLSSVGSTLALGVLFSMTRAVPLLRRFQSQSDCRQFHADFAVRDDDRHEYAWFHL